MKRTLCFAAIAVIAASCSTQPVNLTESTDTVPTIASVAAAEPPVGELPVGPTGLAGPVTATSHGSPRSSSTAELPGLMGHQGPAGTHDRIGDAGMRGPMSIRLTGAASSRGQTLAQGSVAQADTQGPLGMISRWTPYQSFTFDFDRAEIRGGEMNQVSDISSYLAKNPSVRVGLDSSTYPRTTDWRNQDLGERRVAAIRDALIRAGTPASKIQAGSFGDPQVPRNNQVEVLLITAQ